MTAAPVIHADAGALAGQVVAFTGRLASLPRAEAERLVKAAGGATSESITAATTMLVVGMDGWPLLATGWITRKLAAAERRRASAKPVAVTTERAFRERLGLEPAPALEAKQMPATLAAQAAGVDERSLERWEQLGLVPSSAGRYDFRDIVSLRTVTQLVARGVSPVVIRRSLQRLSSMLPGIDRPLAQLNLLVHDRGGLVAEVEGALMGPSGQLEMRFEKPPALSRPALVRLRAPEPGAPGWIEEGLKHEADGDLKAAEQAYRRAAEADPSAPSAHFNLANALLAQRRFAAAAERYAMATALDAAHARAWFNLAHAQDELGRPRAALKSLRRAIAADTAFADSHFNLADLYERLGRRDRAALTWRKYLSLDATSEWADEARRRLSDLENRTDR